MNLPRATVCIPLVELTDQPNQLLEVYCDGQSEWDKKSLDKGWHFIVSPLRPVGLYEEGLQAVHSVHKLSLKIPTLAFYQRLKKYSWLDKQRLHCVNVLDCEGESAQLGLALALLINASGCPFSCVIATGKLSHDTQKDYDVAIDRVNGIPQKLQLLIEKRKNKCLSQAHLYCFTPYDYLKDGNIYKVNELAEVHTLAQLGVEVKPIRWLSEAAKILHAKKSHYLPQDKALLIGAGIISTLLGIMLLFMSWLAYPISIEILPGKNKAEPFLVCTNRNETEVKYYDLKRDGAVALLPILAHENNQYNVGIAWRLKPEKTPLTTLYYVAFIDLGEKSAYKIITQTPNTGQPITVAANEILEWYWPMEEKINKSYEEERILMIALQRVPINLNRLHQQLSTRFPSKERLNILEIRDFLQVQFPGSYAFAYQSTFTLPPCILF